MSQTPYQPPTANSSSPVTQTNVFGMIGLIVSLLGALFTCGLLCPLGLLISLIGLFKPPRGMAIGGTVIGLIGSAFLGTVGIGMILGILGLAKAGKAFVEDAETHATILQARMKIENHRLEKGELPDGIEGNKLILEFKDGWKKELHYEQSEEGQFVVRSAGPDGKFDTADDITSEPTTTSPNIESGTLTPVTPEDTSPVPGPTPTPSEPSESPEPSP